MTAPAPSYAYHAAFLAAHDGDTITLRVDRGQLTHGILDDPTWTIRLYGIDTWEMTGVFKDRGAAAKAFTAATLRAARAITVQTVHPALRAPELEKYGRVLARIWADDDELADLLRAGGHEKQFPPIT